MQVGPCSWSLYRYDEGGVKGMLIITAMWWRDEGGGKGMLMIRAIWWRRRGMRGEILAHCGSQDLIRVDTLIGKQSIIINIMISNFIFWREILEVFHRQYLISVSIKFPSHMKKDILNFKVNICLKFHEERGDKSYVVSMLSKLSKLNFSVQAKTIFLPVQTIIKSWGIWRADRGRC